MQDGNNNPKIYDKGGIRNKRQGCVPQGSRTNYKGGGQSDLKPTVEKKKGRKFSISKESTPESNRKYIGFW